MKINNKRLVWLLVAIIAAGWGLRWWGIVKAGPMWFDELVAVEVAKKPWGEMSRYIGQENNPPVYFWALHFWGGMVGWNNVGVRLLSMMWFLPTAGLLYVLGCRMWGRKAGLLGVTAYSLFGLGVYFSTEARGYAGVFFWTCLWMYFFWEGLQGKGKYSWGKVALMTTGVVMAGYTNLSAWAIIPTAAVILAAVSGVVEKQRWRRVAAGMVISAAVMLPWLVVMGIQKMESGMQPKLWLSAWYLEVSGQVPAIMTLPVSFMEGMVPQEAPLVKLVEMGLAMGIVAGGTAIGIKRRGWDHKTKIGLVVTVCLAVIPPLVSAMTINISVPFYFIPSAVAYWLWWAWSLGQIAEVSNAAKRVVIWLMLGVMVLGFNQYKYSRGSWDKMAGDIQDRGITTVITDSRGLILNSLVDKRVKVIAPIWELDRTVSQKDWLYRLEKYNWIWGTMVLDETGETMVKQEIRQAENEPEGKLALQYFDTLPESWQMLQIVQELGYRCSEEIKYTSVRDNDLYLAIMTKNPKLNQSQSCSDRFSRMTEEE